MSWPVAFYFDFVSPYSWLALTQAEAFASENDVAWSLRPIVYGAVLNETGLIGPAETSVKRSYTFEDVLRCAHEMGLTVSGPPAHPFRSLEALRTFVLFQSEPCALQLGVAIANACWIDGADLTRIDVLEAIVRSCDLDATDLAERIGAPDVKARLAQSTSQALSDGVFGVPTFVVDGQRFWGHDRLPLLASALSGALPAVTDRARTMLERPMGVVRRKPGQ